MIPYGRQSIDASDIRAVNRVLKSDWLTQGPNVRKFEEAFARTTGARYAVALSSGTAGLHLAVLAAGLGKGDEAVTSPLTFVATANAVLYAGASVRFADVSPVTQGLDPSDLHGRINAKTKAVLNVHFAGQPNRIGEKSDYSKRKDFTFIDDACHALGAEVHEDGRWKQIGSHGADMTVFSFHPVKHITTGEGGMVVTDRKDFYEKLLLLRTHGITKDPARFTHREEAGNSWFYEMTDLGFNYRITDIQCALGLSQLARLDRFVARRRAIAARYRRHLEDVPVIHLPAEVPGTRSSYHLFPVRFDFKRLDTTRREVMETLRKNGVGTQVHYIPVTAQPYYRKVVGVKGSFPEAEAFYRQCLSLPMFPAMTDGDVDKVCREVLKICKEMT